jgi:uncharacterized protein (TIGR02271 family)
MVPRELLRPNNDHSYELTVPVSRFFGGQPAQSAGLREEQAAVIPAVEEQLVVTSQPVETGRIRIHKQVEETEAVIDEPLLEDNWEVQRVPVNRILADGAVPETRREGDTLIFPVLEEVLVVEKRLILREEMRVTRRRTERHDPQTHRVRSEHLEVERVR